MFIRRNSATHTIVCLLSMGRMVLRLQVDEMDFLQSTCRPENG